MDNNISRVVPGAISIVQQAFVWMFVGLMVTAVVSLGVASTPSLINALVANRIAFFAIILAELGLVMYLSFRITKMSFAAAVISFVAYAALNGVVLSTIFLAYTSSSIMSAFLVTSLVFGVMALYGYTTKKDLTAVGSLAFMALIGVIIAYLVNMFLQSSTFDFILSFITVFIFVGLTAYDTQKIKQMASMSNSGNLGVFGALALYLDFINIFLSLLRIFGRR